MQYINFLIQVIIYINILYTIITLTRYLISKIAQAVRYKNITQYQITNWYFTIFCTYFYIMILIIGLYCLRLLNMSRTLDLKTIFCNVKDMLSLSLSISYTYTILGIILIIFITINILLSIILIYKSLQNQIYNLYFYIRYNTQDRRNLFSLIFKYNLSFYYDSDLISYWILKLSGYLSERWGYYKLGLVWERDPDIFSPQTEKKQGLFFEYCKNRPWYNFDVILYKIITNKYYKKIFIPLSPIIIILYDCIFNNLVISHVYYYLLIYVPLMLLRKIRTLLSKENITIGDLIWDILYQRETCIYALPKDHRKLFDVYIMNGIKMVDLGPPALMDADESNFMFQCSKFEYIETEKYYQNYEGLEIHEPLLITDNTLKVIRWKNQEEITEYWEPIAIKYHYKATDYYEIIVNISKN